MIEQSHAHHAVALLYQVHHFVVGEHIGAMHSGIVDVSHSQTERVDRSVGHSHCAYEVFVDSRLEDACFGRVDGLGIDACAPARLDKCGLISHVVLGKSDKQAVGFLHAVARYVAQYHILAYAFLGTLVVGYCIASTTVKQTVIAACGSRCQVVAFHKECLQPSHRAVACGAGSRDASAYHNHIVFFFCLVDHRFMLSILFLLNSCCFYFLLYVFEK